jgi:hypothetical protein
MNRENWAFIEITDGQDNPNPLLPGYTDKPAMEDGGESQPWTWMEWCAQPHKAETVRNGKVYIGAATFADRSLALTPSEHASLTAAGVTLIHPDDLPPDLEEEL